MTSKLHENLKRDLEKELKTLSQYYPVVTVLGPRQSGKTTLTRLSFPKKPYVNLEAPDTRAAALFDPRGFFGQYPEGAILDEIQHCPELLSYIQEIIDHRSETGIFILTGSHQPSLIASMTQSLAGRTGLLTLFPLSIKELQSADLLESTMEEIAYNGFYPRIFKSAIPPTKFYRDYLETYVQRDVRQLAAIKDLRQFHLFLKLCAGRTGQLINMNTLATEVGVSSHTIKHWISILEASFVIRILPPYFENIGKRLVKSPKLYFVDTGLCCFLLDIRTPQQLNQHPLRGSIFETMIVMDQLKQSINTGKDYTFYFYRDSAGHEVDLLYQTPKGWVGCEIKASKTFNPNFFKGLKYLTSTLSENLYQSKVIYLGDTMRFQIGVAENFKEIGDLKAKPDAG
jgi:predicted AAA+ superfamily ATPase